MSVAIQTPTPPTADFDFVRYMNKREEVKHGWCVYLIQTDSDGIARLHIIPVWDFYPDGTATCDDDMERYTIARPVPTDMLLERYADRKQYPWLYEADGSCKIMPDNIVSPGYSVLERPYATANAHTGTTFFEPDDIIGAVSRYESDPDTGQTTSLVRVDGTERRDAGRTSFLIQMVVRDRTLMYEHWMGDYGAPGGEQGTWDYSPAMIPWRRTVPCCESGWKVLEFLPNGQFLDAYSLDPCYLGRNIEIGRDTPQVGRFYGPGALDNAIPLNRKINRRKTVLDRSLEFEAVPILVVDEGAGTEIDNRAVEPGDVLRKKQGSQIQWLDFRGVASQQFELLMMDKQDLRTVTGFEESSLGAKPAGIEAAAALRSLQQQVQRRVNGKQIPSARTDARILKKLMVATGKKAKSTIWFRGSNGQLKPMDPEWLTREYDIRFADGSGTVHGREEQEQKVMGMVQAGMMDQQSAMEALGVKNIPQIMQRLSQQQKAMAANNAPPPASEAQIVTALAALLKSDPSSASYAQIQTAVAQLLGVKPQPMDASQQHLEVAKHAKAEKEAAPDPAPVIAGKPGGGGNGKS